MIRFVSIFILLGATFAAFVAVKWLKTRGTDAEQITLLITLTGTLFGVLLALWTGDLYQYVRDCQRLSNLYDAAELELQAHRDDIGEQIKFASALGATHVGSITLPQIIDKIFQEISLHQYFSSTMRDHMFSGLGSFAYAPVVLMLERIANAKKRDVSNYRELLIILYCQMEFQRRFINVEHQYLSWRMSSSRVREQWIQLSREKDQHEEELKRQTWKVIDMKSRPLHKEEDRAPK